MTDQTQRLEIATVKAEIGSNIVHRFSNDALAADAIPTDSGPIQNLKQVIKVIEDKASVSSSIYPTVAAGLAETAEGGIFLVASAEDDEIYAVWKKVSGAAVDTGKRTLSSQAVEDAMDAAQTSAAEAAASALAAQSAASTAAADFQDIFDADQAAREAEFDDFMDHLGYESTYLAYGPGVVVERQTQLVQRDGAFHRVINASDIPLTLTGTWVTDAPKLEDVGDAVLRQALAEPGGSSLSGFQPEGTGAVSRTVEQKLRELVSVSDHGNNLRQALENGAMVRVPATVTSISLSAADSPFVLPNLYRVSAEGDLTINLVAGVHTTATGDMCRVGVRNSTIKLDGVTPTETKATAVTAITGTAGDWSITYTLNSASGAAVGDYAKLFDVGPLPVLSGDNVAPYILRSTPLLGELCVPTLNIGSITFANGGGSVAFSSIPVGALSDYIQSGWLITAKGQTRRLNVIGGTSASIFGAWTNGGLTSSPTYYVTRPNAGTVGTGGVASATVTGTGSAFLTQGNPGDVFLAEGVMSKILSITNNGSLVLDAPVTLVDGTYYSILQSAACLHEGVHEITAVAGNNVTVKNRSQIKPPINGVTCDEFKILKTVLKQTGTGDGFVFDQNGSLRELNNVALVGPGTGIGLLMQSRIPSELAQGVTSFGDVTQNGLRGTLLCGENVGLTRFLRGSMVGHGCLLNGRKLAVTNSTEHGVWVLEGGFGNLRRAQITGGAIGLVVNAGGAAVITEIRLAGCANDGLRSDANATLYGEAPMAIACQGMNYRILDSTKVHLTDSVSLLSALSGVYLDGASARIDKMVIGANGRAGIETTPQVTLHADSCWISGTSNTAGSGYGVQLGGCSTLVSANGAFVGNEGGDIIVPAGTVGAIAYLTSCYYGSFSGVTRLNSPNANGSAIYDGAATDIGSSIPTIGSSGGAIGSVTAVGLNWTRDKDRYEFDARVTVTTVGTATGYLTMSLPFTAAANCSISGTNQSTGVALTGYATGTELRIFSGTGAFPAASGNLLVVSGVVRA
jgi:hypothetical protein